MVQSELQHSGVQEHVGMVNPHDGLTQGFEILRLPRSDKGKARGPRKPVKVVKPVKVSKAKRGPGRPRVYNGTQRRIVAAALKRHGLTKGIEFLATERKLEVSLTLARSVAEEFGISFRRGRPAA